MNHPPLHLCLICVLTALARCTDTLSIPLSILVPLSPLRLR